MAQRPLASVPRPVLALLALALAAQLAWHAGQDAPRGHAAALPPAPSAAALQLASLGEPTAMSKLLMLYLQSHDDQAGVRIAWRELDYTRVRDWLAGALALDPRGQYPLLAASEVYGAVADPARQRLMLDFVYQQFARDPDRRWPWLAHGALVAKHRLHDLPLARQYARAIRLQAPAAPPWARELEAFVLEDMNELEAARAVIGGLIASGQVHDPHELRFLERRLEQLRR
ncbi:MAG: hypothetical protein V4463_03065 [Pseudomonadota bacterium]